MNDEVGVGKQLHMAAIGALYRSIAGSKRGDEGLVIKSVHDRGTVGLKAVTEREG